MRSVHRIQQAVVRMGIDPPFVRRVYAGPVPELTEAERALLVRVDPRAWSVDRYRRSRSVQALIEEYPVTAAILGIPGVDRFFSSDAFAATLAHRGSVALDFGRWAADATAGASTLERAIAAARRDHRPPGPGLCTRPGVEPVVVDEAVLAHHARVRERLGPDPVATFAGGLESVPAPAPTGRTESLVIERDDHGGVGIGGGTRALVELLIFACRPRPRPQVEERAAALGCPPDEAPALVDGLIDDGLLVERR